MEKELQKNQKGKHKWELGEVLDQSSDTKKIQGTGVKLRKVDQDRKIKLS